MTKRRDQPGDPSTIHSADRPISCFLADLIAVGLLWVSVIGLYWRIGLAGRVLAGGDVFTYFYPYWAEATRAIRAGRLPLWNPYLFMGVPFLANSQTGVLYPLNWLLWLILPAYRSVHVTVVLHLCLAACASYLWGRASLRLGRVGAWAVGAIYALGGYLGAQVEHINQLQGLAWLPLILMLYDNSLAPEPQPRLQPQSPDPKTQTRGSRAAFAGLVVVITLVLLAGHTQTAFISLVGLAAYGLSVPLWKGLRQRAWRALVQRMVLLATAVGLAAMLAAVQLVPTWELSRLSVRAGGLPFNERVSFSLEPTYLASALLPGLTQPVLPEKIEYVAYVGVTGLALAICALACHARRSNRAVGSVVFLVVVGLFLSFGLYNPVYLLLARFVPGFAHFRVPARWLALYALGMAALAGWGADGLWLSRHRGTRQGVVLFSGIVVTLIAWAMVAGQVGDGIPVGGITVAGWMIGGLLAVGLLLASGRAPRLATLGLLTLLVLELFVASYALPHSRATAPQAFVSMRPAVAHVLAADGGAESVPTRFISMSDITFDPGDLEEIEIIYGPQLSADALYDYVIATKHKEVLSPNLGLAFGVPAVDGYGGGVLPLARYVMLQHLILPEDQVSMDGRLRENLAAIPEDRWLNLFNVRHVVTDKLRDAWLDDIFYDLQFGARLTRGEMAEVARVPEFEATAVGLVSHLHGGAALMDGTVVGVVEVGFGQGLTRTFELRAGEHTAEGVYGSEVAHAPARVGAHFWEPVPGQAAEKYVEGNDYVSRHQWLEPAAPRRVVVRATLPGGELLVRGVSLIDERTGGFQSLVLSDQGNFYLAHSGDVKIYENLGAFPRAFVAHRMRVAADDEQALALMRDPAFDSADQVVLGSLPNPGSRASGEVEPVYGATIDRVAITHYTPERVEIEVDAGAPGYLVLTDAWYPGWGATVDGKRVPVLQADLLFRAVGVDAGHHLVIFTFRPESLFIGAGISLVGFICLAAVVGLIWGR